MIDKNNLGQSIATESIRWLGTPYDHHSAICSTGCDCVGMLIGILKQIGLMDKQYQPRFYSKQWMLHRSEEILIEDLNKYSSEVNKNELSAGDILLFKFGRAASHMGIYFEDNLFIHCWAKKGVCKSALKNSIWEKRLVKIVRLDYEKLPISA